MVGYLKKGSKASLIAGLVCGGLYGVSGYLINSNNEQGHDIAAVTSVVLAAVMGSRVIKYFAFSLSPFLSLSLSFSLPLINVIYLILFPIAFADSYCSYRTGKFMPAGLVTAGATIVGSYSIYKSYGFRAGGDL